MCVNHKDFCVYEHYKIYKSLWPLLCTLLPSRLWSGLCRFICFRCLAVRMATMSHMSHKSRHSDGLCGFIWCLEEKGHVRRVKRVQNPHPIDPILVRCGKDSRQWLLWHIVTIIPNILGIIGTTYNQQWFWSLLQWVDFWTRDTDFIRSHDVIWTQWVWIFWPKKSLTFVWHVAVATEFRYRSWITEELAVSAASFPGEPASRSAAAERGMKTGACSKGHTQFA